MLAFSTLRTVAQCVQHPAGKTAIVLNNETSYELTLFVDDIDRGAVPPAKRGSEIEIIPGQHLLGARATIQGQNFWVMIVNEINRGELCAWTVLDPQDANRSTESIPKIRTAGR
jgi:hypothetical protein